MDTVTNKLICPAGHPMWLESPNFKSNDGRYVGKSYAGHVEYCMNCSIRSKCIQLEHTKYRQVVVLKEVSNKDGRNPVEEMKNKIDTPYGRSVYSRRMSTVEPVFGHIAGIKKLNRFTLRGKQKVNTQWLLYCPGRLFYNLLGLAAHMVHNIGKVRIEWS